MVIFGKANTPRIVWSGVSLKQLGSHNSLCNSEFAELLQHRHCCDMAGITLTEVFPQPDTIRVKIVIQNRRSEG